MNKNRKNGKVIKFFTVEIVSSDSDPTLVDNPNNPYTLMTQDARINDLVSTLGILWAESCKIASINKVKN